MSVAEKSRGGGGWLIKTAAECVINLFYDLRRFTSPRGTSGKKKQTLSSFIAEAALVRGDRKAYTKGTPRSII